MPRTRSRSPPIDDDELMRLGRLVDWFVRENPTCTECKDTMIDYPGYQLLVIRTETEHAWLIFCGMSCQLTYLLGKIDTMKDLPEWINQVKALSSIKKMEARKTMGAS